MCQVCNSVVKASASVPNPVIRKDHHVQKECFTKLMQNIVRPLVDIGLQCRRQWKFSLDRCRQDLKQLRLPGLAVAQKCINNPAIKKQNKENPGKEATKEKRDQNRYCKEHE